MSAGACQERVRLTDDANHLPPRGIPLQFQGGRLRGQCPAMCHTINSVCAAKHHHHQCDPKTQPRQGLQRKSKYGIRRDDGLGLPRNPKLVQPKLPQPKPFRCLLVFAWVTLVLRGDARVSAKEPQREMSTESASSPRSSSSSSSSPSPSSSSSPEQA
jgi:hypothetical protein